MIEKHLSSLEKKINSLCLPEGTYKPTVMEIIKWSIIYHDTGKDCFPHNLDMEHTRKVMRAILGKGDITDEK